MTKSMMAVIAEAAGLNNPLYHPLPAPAVAATAQRPDVEGYIASIKGNDFSGPPTPTEKEQIETYANTWQESADIRNEFKTFPAYAAYMRAKARGFVKHYGGSKVRD